MKWLSSLYTRVWLNVGIYCGFCGLCIVTLIASQIAYSALRWHKGLPKRVAVQTIIWYYAKVGTWILRCFYPVTFVNKFGPLEDVPQPCILIANHQSVFDLYCLSYNPIKTLCFVVSDWPFKLPFFSFFMRQAGYLNNKKLSGEGLLHKAVEAIQQGSSLALFPEGTRSSSGALGRLHSGAFIVAMRTGVPIVTLCINGTGRMLPKHSYALYPSRIRITVLPAIYPKDFLEYGDNDYKRLRAQVAATLRQELQDSV